MIRRFRALSSILLLLGAALPAFGQGALLQGGPWQPGHVPQYVGQGSSQAVVQDGGGAGGGAVGVNPSEIGVTARGTGTAPYAAQGTGPYGTNICDYDAPTNNAVGYHFLCLSANAQGGGLLAYGSGGAATALPLSFIVNGIAYTFPFSGTGGGSVFPNGITSGGVNTSYYVATTGSDLNSCLTALLPCLTLQGAWNKAVVSNYGLGGVTIRIADGTYGGPLIGAGTWAGAGPVAIVGNTTTPSNVVLNVSGNNAIKIKDAYVRISGIKFITAATFGQVVASDGGDISISNVEFSGTTGQHITAANDGRVHITGNYTITGGGESHWHALVGGLIDVTNSPVITLTGTPAFSAYFAGVAYDGKINVGGGTSFSGAASGPKFLAHNLGKIDTGGLGCSNLPGSSPGAFFDTWGLCDGLFSGVNGLAAGAPLVADSFFTGNSNTAATAALSSPSQFHAVGANSTAAGYACDGFGNFPGYCLDFARLALGTAAAPTAVTGSAFVKTIGAQAYDSTGAYGTVAALDLLTTTSQTGTDHGGMIWGRVVLPGTTTLIEEFRVGAGFMIGTAVPPGHKNLSVAGAVFTAIPVTLTGTSGSVGASDSSVIVNASGGFTLTLPSAATNAGRWLNLKSVAAQTIVSASGNVVPLAGGAATTALLSASAGKWANLQSDGSNWIIMASN